MPDKIPVLVEMAVINKEAPFKVVGMVNNCEFIFFTNDDATVWFFEMSTSWQASVDTLMKGDDHFFAVSNDYKEEEPLNVERCQYLVVTICGRIVEQGVIRRGKERGR